VSAFALQTYTFTYNTGNTETDVDSPELTHSMVLEKYPEIETNDEEFNVIIGAGITTLKAENYSGTFDAYDNQIFEKLLSVNFLSNDLQMIDSFAFYLCVGLKEVSSMSVELLGVGAFNLCTNLVDINFPSVTILEDHAFAGCRSLKHVYFPNVDSIK